MSPGTHRGSGVEGGEEAGGLSQYQAAQKGEWEGHRGDLPSAKPGWPWPSYPSELPPSTTRGKVVLLVSSLHDKSGNPRVRRAVPWLSRLCFLSLLLSTG